MGEPAENGMMRWAAKAMRLLPVMLFFALCACASGGQDRLADSPGAFGPPDPVDYANSKVDEYRISPYDKLSIAVFPVRDYTVPAVRVAADGSILVPPLGSIRAQGKTIAALAAEIEAGLTECCLRKPQVVVQVEETISQQVTVTGAVKSANVYNLRGPTTLVKAINLAGGPDLGIADIRRVGIIRQINGQRAGKIFNLREIQAGRAEDPEVFGGDQIIVDTSDAKSAWRTVLSAIPVSSIFAVF
jgi:polysaccharide biosynthesis/export protein